MPWSLLEVDDLIRCDHWHLRRDDRCFFLREYIPRAGFAGGDTNSLILNLKKSPDRRGRLEWRHKSDAIARVVRELSVSLRAQPIAGALIVPIPPSKAPTDPLYDDRMVQVAQQLAGPSGAIACELLVREVSAPPLHQGDRRRDLDELRAQIRVRTPRDVACPQRIFVLDDVLTTGAHFRVAKDALSSVFRAAEIFGLFIARRIPSPGPP